MVQNVGIITALMIRVRNTTTLEKAKLGRPGDAKPTGLSESAGLPKEIEWTR